MARAYAPSQCSRCDKTKSTSICTGCRAIYCRDHLREHDQKISNDFEQIRDEINLFQEKIYDQKTDSKKRALLNLINEWETSTFEQIRQRADQLRDKVIASTNQSIANLERKLNALKESFQTNMKEENYNEQDLDEANRQLSRLNELLDRPKSIMTYKEETSFVPNLFVVTSDDIKFKQNGENQLDQLGYPHGLAFDRHGNLFVADWNNHRIINVTTKQIVAGGFGKGGAPNQLDGPTDVVYDRITNSFIIADRGNQRVVRWSNGNSEILIQNIDCWGLALDKDGSLYITDTERCEVRCYTKTDRNGFKAIGGNGQGTQLNQLRFPTYILIDDDYSIYVSDSLNHRVMKWPLEAKQGIVVAGGHGQGHSLRQLSYCQGIAVDRFGDVYVADGYNHRVVRWTEYADEGTLVVGGNGKGEQANQLSCPRGLTFGDLGSLYVADGQNHRIQKFIIE